MELEPKGKVWGCRVGLVPSIFGMLNPKVNKQLKMVCPVVEDARVLS